MAKAAEIKPGLVVKKGAATVADGAPQRSAAASPAKSDPAPTQGSQLVPLNFRVPKEFREELETYAFNSFPRRKLVAVLKDAFAALKQQEGK